MKKISDVNELACEGARQLGSLSELLHTRIQSVIVEDFTNTMVGKLKSGGKLIITGVGKNFWMAQKLAATAQSLNITALAFDVTHALHGDLGVIAENDVIWGFSKSGSTGELTATMNYIKSNPKRFKNVTLLGTKMGAWESKNVMDEWSDKCLCLPELSELDEWNRVPSVSLAAIQIVSDAVIIAAASRLHDGNFTFDDFQITHPGGSIGGKN